MWKPPAIFKEHHARYSIKETPLLIPSESAVTKAEILMKTLYCIILTRVLVYNFSRHYTFIALPARGIAISLARNVSVHSINKL